jgi:hypothetical protein
MKTKAKIDVKKIEQKALRGEDVSKYFGEPRLVDGATVRILKIQRVNVDFTGPMLSELDALANEMNVSRQAVIKMLLRLSLDNHYVAAKARDAS